MRRRVLILIDSMGLAEVEALQYATALRCECVTAVHFVIDESRAAHLQVRWPSFGLSAELRVIDCEDRNLGQAAHDLVAHERRDHPDSAVSVLLPRRMYSPLVGRLLHDRTADAMARAVSRIPGATAHILVCDVKSRVARAIAATGGNVSAPPIRTRGESQATTPAN